MSPSLPVRRTKVTEIDTCGRGVGLDVHPASAYSAPQSTWYHWAASVGRQFMRELGRRIRGAIGMGFTWGAAWSVAGFVLAVITRFQADAPFPIIFGVLGF